jgi:sec-independent protein translocase protein TatB
MLSVPHLIIIFLVALVVFGPEKLPELARNFGKVMAEFRRATGDLRSTFEDHMRDLEREAGERRTATGRTEATAPFTVTGGPNAAAPANVVATTPLSARMRPDVSAIVPGETDVLPMPGAESREAPPSIGELNRRRMPGSTPESVPDPAASLAPDAASSPNEPTDENGPKSEIVNDGHASS